MLPVNRRVLIVDDNADIHNDFKKILGTGKRKPRRNLTAIEEALFEDDAEDLRNHDEDDDVPDVARVTYELDFAYQGTEAVEKVTKSFEDGRPYALVFMDVRMPPGIDGVETISRIWERHPNVEMVICTAYSDYSFDGVLEKLGTSDRLLFLTKPFDSIAVKQMALSLSRKWTLHEQERHQLERLESEARQRRESESRLHEIIHRDNLTGFSNRRQLNISLADAIRNARQTGTRFALFAVELLRFNEVIDTLGYKIGDKLIRNIAERFTERLAHRGTLFRQGNHEFALLTSEIHSLRDTHEIAKTALGLFEKSFDQSGLNIDIQAAVGIVIFPDHGAGADMLIRHADITMMYARRSEQGYCYYDNSMNKFSPQRLTLLTDLRKAINNDELLLYYQPKLDVKTGAITGVETLSRWAHETLGFVPPASFIPIAEQCGLIKPLTNWVLGKVAGQWRRWREQDLDLRISVNLTAHDLQDQDLHKKIFAILENAEMPVDRLCLEVSERGIMLDREQAVITLSKIRDMGISITIDNFGTGYSSLAYLKNLPVDEIKIDHSFIEELNDKPNELAIVRSMIDLGHNLGLRVSADGVATEIGFNLLRDFGCDSLQGNHINMAVPPGELNLWLKDAHWPRAHVLETKQVSGSGG